MDFEVARRIPYVCPNGCEGIIYANVNPRRLLIDCPHCKWFWEYTFPVEKKTPKKKKRRK